MASSYAKALAQMLDRVGADLPHNERGAVEYAMHVLNERAGPLTVERLVERDVIYCVSSLVYSLTVENAKDISTGLAVDEDQAIDLWRVPVTHDVKLECLAENNITVREVTDDDLNDVIATSTKDLVSDHFNVGDWAYCDAAGLHGPYADADEATDAAIEENHLDDRVEEFAGEVFEHWIVSDWLADKLEAKGQRIVRDFLGLTVWGRTCTGQGIACDSVMKEIVKDIIETVNPGA